MRLGGGLDAHQSTQEGAWIRRGHQPYLRNRDGGDLIRIVGPDLRRLPGYRGVGDVGARRSWTRESRACTHHNDRDVASSYHLPPDGAMT